MGEAVTLSDQLVHVPTVEELTRQGLAKPSQHGGHTISPEGQRMITDAMMHNGRILKIDADAHERTIDRGNATTEETLARMQRAEDGHKRARQMP